MTEYEIFKNQTLKLLGEIISYESAKPDDEADFDLIEDCEKMMCDLLEGSATLSDEEIRIRIEKVKQKTQVSKPKKKVHKGLSRGAAAVLCAVLVLCISVCAVCVISPEIREGIMKSLGISVGESVDVNGVTFVNNGTSQKYTDILTLISENKLDIMYPHKLPVNIGIESVHYYKQSHIPVTMVFSDNSGNVQIYIKDNGLLEELKVGAEPQSFGGNLFYIIDLQDRWGALISDDQYTYYISYKDQMGLYTILEEFRK